MKPSKKKTEWEITLYIGPYHRPNYGNEYLYCLFFIITITTSEDTPITVFNWPNAAFYTSEIWPGSALKTFYSIITFTSSEYYSFKIKY